MMSDQDQTSSQKIDALQRQLDAKRDKRIDKHSERISAVEVGLHAFRTEVASFRSEMNSKLTHIDTQVTGVKEGKAKVPWWQIVMFIMPWLVGLVMVVAYLLAGRLPPANLPMP